jgi:hypothetical protein
MAQSNPAPRPQPSPQIENQKYGIFVALQVFFLIVSTFTGGFNFTVWSMLDSAILIVSIGLSGLLFVLDERELRIGVFYISIVLYLIGVLDMAVNILISGSIGWNW